MAVGLSKWCDMLFPLFLVDGRDIAATAIPGANGATRPDSAIVTTSVDAPLGGPTRRRVTASAYAPTHSLGAAFA